MIVTAVYSAYVMYNSATIWAMDAFTHKQHWVVIEQLRLLELTALRETEQTGNPQIKQ